MLLVQMSGTVKLQFSGCRTTVDCSDGKGVGCFVICVVEAASPLWAKDGDDDDGDDNDDDIWDDDEGGEGDDDDDGDHKNEAVS